MATSGGDRPSLWQTLEVRLSSSNENLSAAKAAVEKSIYLEPSPVESVGATGAGVAKKSNTVAKTKQKRKSPMKRQSHKSKQASKAAKADIDAQRKQLQKRFNNRIGGNKGTANSSDCYVHIEGKFGSPKVCRVVNKAESDGLYIREVGYFDKVDAKQSYECCFCHDRSNLMLFGPYPLTVGSKVKHKQAWFHSECFLWSPGCLFSGKSIIGLNEAVNHSTTCCMCKRDRATLGCLRKNCTKSFHYACAAATQESGVTFNSENCTLMCAAHSV